MFLMPRAVTGRSRCRQRIIALAWLAVAVAGAQALPEVPPDLQALVNAGQYGRALQVVEAQSAQAPKDAQLIAQWAMLLSLHRRDGQALRLLEGLSVRQPELAAPHHLTALILAGGGDYDAARSAIGRALRADPGYVPALKTLGEIHARQARQAYEQVLRYDRNDALLRQRVDAMAVWLGPVLSPFIQSGALLALAPPPPPPAASVPAAAALPTPSATLFTPSTSPVVLLGGTLPSTAAARAAPAAASGSRVLVPAPAGLRTAEVAAATRDLGNNEVKTFDVVSTGADVPTGFFGVPRLAVVAPAAASAVAASAASSGAAPSTLLAMSTAARAPRAAPADAPAAAPPAAAAPKPVDLPAGAARQAEVDAALRQWAAAWSRRDVAAYLAAYAGDFKGNAASRTAWERERRERIGARSQIRVELSEVVINVDGNRAEARFRQSYVADKASAVNRKLLQWQREPGGVWLIRREAVEG